MEALKEAYQSVYAVWAFELFSVEGHPITVGSLFIGGCFLYLGYRLAKRASDVVDKRVLSHMNLEPSLRVQAHRLSYYFFFFLVILFTLKTLNVPLTVFTVLGGALAIGFGFGSQNIVNNFISGIILMVERPVRVDDVIEVDGLRGTVESIGIRATHMRTADNKMVILPNSIFLEKAVVNWTLNDTVLRSKVTVGVSYNCKSETVKEILLNACGDVKEILKFPAPFIVFADFGDNALIFETYFWVDTKAGRITSEIESDLRFVIDRRFRQANIGVPYPQRDLHLDTVKPLQVEIRPPS